MIFHFCGAVNFNLLNRSHKDRLTDSSGNRESDPMLNLAHAFMALLASLMEQVDESSSEDRDDRDAESSSPPFSLCRWCRVDLTKSLALLCSVLVRACVDRRTSALLELGDMHGQAADLYTAARSCILTLHGMWSADRQQVLADISTSSLIQRRYLWATKQLGKLQPCLNLPPSDREFIFHSCYNLL